MSRVYKDLKQVQARLDAVSSERAKDKVFNQLQSQIDYWCEEAVHYRKVCGEQKTEIEGLASKVKLFTEEIAYLKSN